MAKECNYFFSQKGLTKIDNIEALWNEYSKGLALFIGESRICHGSVMELSDEDTLEIEYTNDLEGIYQIWYKTIKEGK